MRKSREEDGCAAEKQRNNKPEAYHLFPEECLRRPAGSVSTRAIEERCGTIKTAWRH